MCKRGEVYYIRYNDAIGSEQFVGRPGIIVSSNQSCDLGSVVQVIYTTTQYREYWFNPVLSSTTRRSWALCDQVTTVDKMRLGDRMCVLTEEEMVAVDDALRGVLGLEWPDAEEEAEPVDEMDELAELRVEAELYHRMYDKLMDKMVNWYGEKRISEAVK